MSSATSASSGLSITAPRVDAFLSEQEIFQLTGYRRRRLQLDQLVKLNIPHFVNARGRIVVPRDLISRKTLPSPELGAVR